MDEEALANGRADEEYMEVFDWLQLEGPFILVRLELKISLISD